MSAQPNSDDDTSVDSAPDSKPDESGEIEDAHASFLDEDPTSTVQEAVENIQSRRRSTPDIHRTIYQNEVHFHERVSVAGELLAGVKSVGDSGRHATPILASVQPLGRPPFVDPQHFSQLASRLKIRPLVVLRSRPDVGCRTSVVQALADIGLPIAEVDPRLGITSVAQSDLPRRSGLILDKSNEERFPLHPYEIEILSEQLDSRQSKMVILVSPLTSSHGLPGEAFVSATNSPPGSAMVSAWIEARTGRSSDFSAQGLQTQLDTAGLSLTPTEASTLADMLVGVDSADCIGDCIERIAQARPERITQQLGELLEQHSLTDAALLIAVLVLSGAPESTILEASRGLEQEFNRDYPDAVQQTGPFAQPLSTRLRSLELCRSRGSEGREDTLELIDPSLNELMLQQLWLEYGIQETVCRWLTDLPCRLPISAAGIVSTAVSMLLPCDADLIGQRLIRPWSVSERLCDRLVSALTIGLAARVGQVEPTTLLQLVQRLRGSHQWQERWTAAFSIGVGVGDRYPQFGLSILDQSFLDNQKAVRLVAVSSLRTLLQMALYDPSRLTQLCASLVPWIRDRKGVLRRVALAAALAELLTRDDCKSELTKVDCLSEIGHLLGLLLARRDSRTLVKPILRNVIMILNSLSESDVRNVMTHLAPTKEDGDRLQFLLSNIMDADTFFLTARDRIFKSMELSA